MSGNDLLNWLQKLDPELLKCPVEVGHLVRANRDGPDYDEYHIATKVMCESDYYNPRCSTQRVRFGPHDAPGKLAILIS